MNRLILEVPGRAPSLNTWAGGQSYFTKNKTKKDWMSTFDAYLTAEGWPRELDTPLKVYVTSYLCRNGDVDNTALVAKFFLDCLVKRKMIPDDNMDYIPTVVYNALRVPKFKDQKIIIIVEF